MNIIQDFIPIGRKNRNGRANPMLSICVHNTGNANKGAGAKNHAAYLKAGAADVPASWHYTVDDKEIIQHLPENECGQHTATPKGNAESIGIEICMNSDGDLLKATDNAAWLVADICRRRGIPLLKVLQHNDWSGKNCPQMIRAGKPYNWNTFISKVTRELEIMNTPTAPPKPPEPAKNPDAPSSWAVNGCAKLISRGIVEGDGKGRYGWKEPVTLEKMATLLDKAGLI